MILTFLLFYLVNFIIFKVNASFQSNPTIFVQGLTGINGTTIMISSDQTMIGAGFMDGTFKLYDIELNEICSNISTIASSIIASVWMPSFGPVTVDSSNKLTIWSTQCKIQNQLSFSTPIKGIGFYQSIDNSTGQATGNPTGFIALNFGNFIQQFDVENFNLLTQYVSNNQNDTFLDFLYFNNATRNMLIVSTQSSKISIMSMQTGVQTQSFDIQSPIKMMTVFEKTGEQKIILGYGQNNYIYRFTSGGQPYQLKQFPPSDSIIFCPSNKQFALAFRQSKQIGVYLYSGDNQKILNTLQGIPTGIDCSQSYLVAIDDKGYISVYAYQQFKNWIIAVIIGIAVGLFLLIAAVAVFIFFRKKRAKQTNKQNDYSQYTKKYPKPKIKQPSKTDDGYLLENVTPIKLYQKSITSVKQNKKTFFITYLIYFLSFLTFLNFNKEQFYLNINETKLENITSKEKLFKGKMIKKFNSVSFLNQFSFLSSYKIKNSKLIVYSNPFVKLNSLRQNKAYSNNLTRAIFFLLNDWFGFSLQNCSHSFIKNFFQSLLSQGAAFHVLTLEFVFNDLSCCLLLDWRFFRILLNNLVLLSQIDLVSNKYFWNVSNVFSQLWVPLSQKLITFFLALTKDEGSTTEKTIRKTSQ